MVSLHEEAQEECKHAHLSITLCSLSHTNKIIHSACKWWAKGLFMQNWKAVQVPALGLSNFCCKHFGISSECERVQRAFLRKRFHQNTVAVTHVSKATERTVKGCH